MIATLVLVILDRRSAVATGMAPRGSSVGGLLVGLGGGVVELLRRGRTALGRLDDRGPGERTEVEIAVAEIGGNPGDAVGSGEGETAGGGVGIGGGSSRRRSATRRIAT